MTWLDSPVLMVFQDLGQEGWLGFLALVVVIKIYSSVFCSFHLVVVTVWSRRYITLLQVHGRSVDLGQQNIFLSPPFGKGMVSCSVPHGA